MSSPNLNLLLVLGATAVVSFASWLRSMKAARHSEDFATTRIRSAAQGYVELFGMTRPPAGGVLKAPLTGRSCVWWQYSISEVINDQVEIKQGESRQPFYIEDATGRCLINPSDAELTPSDTKSWQANKSPTLEDEVPALQAEFLPPRYRCTESILLPNVRLYVLGEFRTLRKAPHALDRMRTRLAAWLKDHKLRAILDVNRDGRLDETELEAARRAAMLDARREVGTSVTSEDVVAKPRDGRPFVIAARVKPTHVRTHHAEAVISLVCFAASALALIWVLTW